MRRFISLILFATLLLALCGCNTESPKADRSEGAKDLTDLNDIAAIQVGSHTLSAVELNYFYVDEIAAYCKEYGSYLSYILDTTKSIGDQFYDEANKVTWADYLLDNTIESIKETYALYDAAQAAGFTLSAEDLSDLDTTKENLKTNALYYGYNSTNQYLISIYGSDADQTSYLKYYEILKTAEAYYEAYCEAHPEDSESWKNNLLLNITVEKKDDSHIDRDMKLQNLNY